jgi:signal transduction histidine kinase
VELGKAINLMARSMGHDFNNLLQGVVGAISVAKLSTGPTNELYKILELAERSSAQARELGQRLVLFAKGVGNLDKTGNLATLIPGTVKGTLRGAPIACRFDLPEDNPVVRYDESYLQHLISILTINGMEAMDGKGTLEIEAWPFEQDGARFLRFTFRDSGRGIAPENLEKVFDPAFTTKQGAARQKGTGGSLAVARIIAQVHGGTLTAEADQERGAAFLLDLPVA